MALMLCGSVATPGRNPMQGDTNEKVLLKISSKSSASIASDQSKWTQNEIMKLGSIITLWQPICRPDNYVKAIPFDYLASHWERSIRMHEGIRERQCKGTMDKQVREDKDLFR
ncbi:unnamed protein product [Dovyalis caffra]|uniref:Uncharacterized protein n=1 Tax=Dovyalis caffra TaxID=77055 RepID=A0AAV1QVF4_9ROSI|nr:unnamed protein product [Dovyalis caffra]